MGLWTVLDVDDDDDDDDDDEWFLLLDASNERKSWNCRPSFGIIRRGGFFGVDIVEGELLLRLVVVEGVDASMVGAKLDTNNDDDDDDDDNNNLPGRGRWWHIRCGCALLCKITRFIMIIVLRACATQQRAWLVSTVKVKGTRAMMRDEQDLAAALYVSQTVNDGVPIHTPHNPTTKEQTSNNRLRPTL